MDTVFVKCNITQREARRIIAEWGGTPGKTIRIDHRDGTQTRITSSITPVYE
jgi:hypothetical protein